MSKVFLGIPMYDGRLHFATAMAAMLVSSRKHQVSIHPARSSLLPHNCTSLWTMALNAHAADPAFEWFAMLHDDIQPQDYWLDILIDEAERSGADFVSALAPMKNDAGVMSTALYWPESPMGSTRITTAQANHADFPTTFDAQEAAEALGRLPPPLRVEGVPGNVLLANTGCMVCRLRNWPDSVRFNNQTMILGGPGQKESLNFSEDWFFTQRLAEAGGKVMATKAVRIAHYGCADFFSWQVWGRPRDA